jgi:uncharacterized Zn-binding protein involved in type VI secretion
MVTPGVPPIPHVGGPIVQGLPTVMIGFMPAARVSDMAVCVGPPDTIVKGSPTVHIGNLMAARLGDNTAHGGVVVMGCPTVMIGDGVPPLFGQETPMSCGPASVRMTIATVTGEVIPESTLRNETNYTLANGTNMSDLETALHNHGVPNARMQSGVSVADLQAATAGNHPAIIHYNNPGGGGHFAVVDRVTTNPDGTRTLSVRDPWPPGGGTRRQMSEADFNARGFSGWAITTNP